MLISISSYKGHSIFAIILSLLFFPNPVFIAMALIGANLPDFDHSIKKVNLYKMIIVGITLSIFLYVLGLPFFIGIILCILPAIFYFSNHRGFTHSLLGIAILSILLFLVVAMGVDILSPILSLLGVFNPNFSQELISLSFIIMGLAILTLNKKVIVPFLLLFLLGILFLPDGILIYHISFYNNLYANISILEHINSLVNYNNYRLLIITWFPLFLGLLSHLILDSLSPSGIELFRPFSSKKVHKEFALICLILLGIILFISISTSLFFIGKL